MCLRIQDHPVGDRRYGNFLYMIRRDKLIAVKQGDGFGNLHKRYLYNLNIGHAYKEFRLARAKMRAHGLPLQAQVLAAHLDRYSQRGKQYVSDLQKLIRSPLIATMAKASLGHTEQKVLVASLDSAIHTE